MRFSEDVRLERFSREHVCLLPGGTCSHLSSLSLLTSSVRTLCVFTGFGEHKCMSPRCIVGNICSIFEKQSTGPKLHSLTLTHNATQRVSDITGGSL